MEVQYVKNENNREENFILPETEKAINGIIAEIGRTFSLSRVLLQIVYIAYLAMRTFYMERFFAFNVVLLTICILQLLFFFADLNGKKRISGKVDLPFRIAKRLVSLAVAGIFFMDIFVLSETVQRWQAVSGVLICLGWIMAFIGDLFLRLFQDTRGSYSTALKRISSRLPLFPVALKKQRKLPDIWQKERL